MTLRIARRPGAAALACLLAAGTPVNAQSPISGRNTRLAPYRVLDTVEGAWIDLLTAPTRPMAIDPANGHLFALNAHDSAVVELDAAGAVLRTIRVPWGPVSVGLWRAEPEAESDLLVVSQGTHALSRIDLASGAIVALIPLPTEPSFLLVHPTTGTAFVSCPGDDSVVEVDVAASRVLRRYPIPSKRPTFMALDADGGVLVAPMMSGNNSVVDDGTLILAPGEGRVLDLEDPAIAQEGLADHDLFRIQPGRAAVVPVARDTGAILFAVGRNPATGDVWQLGTEANNKDPNRIGEPAVRGDFIVNQIARIQVGGPGAVAPPFDVIDLDDADPATDGVQFDPTRTVGQPCAVDFDGDGNAYVVGLLTHNVTQYSAAGAFVREWNVGSIPRGVLVDEAGERAHVYCWGSNVVETYDLTQGTPAKLASADLGFDPTPPRRQDGRELFYTATFSEHNNASCNSCHIEVDTDMLPWDLSDMPADDKGPLVTQTMRGIEDLAPFHWRGERASLLDFNGAFDGLLGSIPLDTTPGGAFDRFEEFVFSIEQPANPNEHPSRMVDGSMPIRTADGALHESDAIAGQDAYFDVTSVVGVGSCNICHTMPTGTSNEVVLDEPTLDFPRRNHFVVASYNGVWRKAQPTLETIVLADGTAETRPTVGAGIAATGIKDDILDFVNINLFNLTPKQRRDITGFVTQADSGLAPAVHRAQLLGQQGALVAWREIERYLLPQATKRNADLVAFGTVDLQDGAGTRELRWFFDRTTRRFQCEDSSVPAQAAGFFLHQASSGLGSNLFVGLPVGMGERFGVDFDHDQVFNLDEVALGTDPFDPDSDGDGARDGHEVANGGDPLDDGVLPDDMVAPVVENLRVVYVTNRVAKIQFDTVEPTRFDAAWTSANQSGGDSSDLFEKTHTVLLTGLRSGKDHDVTLTVEDQGGNTVDVPIEGGIRTLDATLSFATILRFGEVTVLEDSNGTLRFQIAGRVRPKVGAGNVPGRQMRVQVSVNGTVTQEVLNGTTSGADGITTVEVTESGLSVNDEVRVSVLTLFDVQQGNGIFWSMPDTAPEDREFRVTYTGTGP